MGREIKTIEDEADVDATAFMRGVVERSRRLTAMEEQMSDCKKEWKRLKDGRDEILSDLRSYIREQSEPLLPFEKAA